MPGTSKRFAIVLFLLTSAGIPRARAQMVTPIGDPLRGERSFNEKGCARCHGANAQGTAHAPKLDRVASQQTPLELAARIWNHAPGMNAKARELGVKLPVLTGAETGDVLAFLYSLSFVDAPGNAKRGALLVREKQCVSCHAERDAAAADAPSLNRVARFASPAAMLHAMWGHAANMQDEMRARQLRRVTFGGTDMADILAYFRTIAPTAGNPPPVKGDAREGGQLFSVKGCSRCHAVHGYGGRLAQDLGSHKLPRTPSAMAGVLWNHGSRMRQLMDRYGVPLPTFSRSEFMDVVAYIYFLGFNDPPGNAQRGRVLFTARGCNRCHAAGPGARPRSGPDLSHSQAVLSSLEAARLMWGHAPKMEAQLKELGIKWPQFGRGEMADLIAYLTSLQQTSAQ